jgi:branched-chain amino acid transport system ATP-binding protein
MTAVSNAAAPVDQASGGRPRLTVSDVSVHFGGIRAVRDVSLEVGAGELRGLIGPNGAGKTTLFDVISGVRQPTHGRVCIDGRDVTKTSSMWRARHGLRRTFQRQQIFTWLSVEDNILAALEWRGWAGGVVGDALGLPNTRRLEKQRRAKVRELIERCNLDDVREVAIGNLPIATVRMVELARALIDEPRLLLLDEPTSGLHPSDCAIVAGIVSDYRDRTGCSVIVVEHDIELVLDLCDRITVLETGAIIFDGTPDEARRDPEVRRAYIGGGDETSEEA